MALTKCQITGGLIVVAIIGFVVYKKMSKKTDKSKTDTAKTDKDKQAKNPSIKSADGTPDYSYLSYGLKSWDKPDIARMGGSY